MAELAEQRKVPPWILRAILWFWLTGVGVWVSYLVFESLRSLVIQIVLALFFSFAMEPGVDRLHRRGMSRGAATAVTMLTVVILIIGFLAAMGSLIANQLNQLVIDLPGYVESGQLWLDSNLNITIESTSSWLVHSGHFVPGVNYCVIHVLLHR